MHCSECVEGTIQYCVFVCASNLTEIEAMRDAKTADRVRWCLASGKSRASTRLWPQLQAALDVSSGLCRSSRWTSKNPLTAS